MNDIDDAWWQPDVSTIALGAPFRPGLDPLPAWQHAWAVVKDRNGRAAHGEPKDALQRVIIPLPELGPNEALGYVLYAGLTYNAVFAARGEDGVVSEPGVEHVTERFVGPELRQGDDHALQSVLRLAVGGPPVPVLDHRPRVLPRGKRIEPRPKRRAERNRGNVRLPPSVVDVVHGHHSIALRLLCGRPVRKI